MTRHSRGPNRDKFPPSHPWIEQSSAMRYLLDTNTCIAAIPDRWKTRTTSFAALGEVGGVIHQRFGPTFGPWITRLLVGIIQCRSGNSPSRFPIVRATVSI